MHTYSNTAVDLRNFTPDMVVKADITHALLRNIRFNGHINADFTVYEHSLIGAYLGDTPEHQLEALLHDVGETYTGDIILPIKDCFPEIAALEDQITAVVFDKLWPGSGLTAGGRYKKSTYMANLDRQMAAWESLKFRPHHTFTHETWETRGVWLDAYHDIRECMVDAFITGGGEAGYHGLFWDWYDALMDSIREEEAYAKVAS